MYKAELARLQASSAAVSTGSFTPTPVGNSPFITTISSAAPALSPTTPATSTVSPAALSPASPQPVEPVRKAPVVEQRVTWSTPEEARAAFENLLREKGITSSTPWKEAVTLIASDIRYTALRTSGQRKQVFSEFVNRQAKEEREAKLRQQVSAREAFRAMLKASSLTGRSTLREAEALLGRDNRWTDLDRSGREEEFRYYVSKLDEKERNVSDGGDNGNDDE